MDGRVTLSQGWRGLLHLCCQQKQNVCCRQSSCQAPGKQPTSECYRAFHFPLADRTVAGNWYSRLRLASVPQLPCCHPSEDHKVVRHEMLRSYPCHREIKTQS